MYDPDCHVLADHFLTEDKPETMTTKVYEDHVERLAQEIQDAVELFCEFDTKWQGAIAKDLIESVQ